MERLTSSALGEVLDKVAPAIAAGSVNVVSVEAIRERSGARWARKREQVESFALRAFARLSEPGDFIVALNDAEFLIVQPSLVGSAAVSASAKLLHETLTFFLGSVAQEDLRLFRVTGYRDGALDVSRVDAATSPHAPAPAPALWEGRQGEADPPPGELLAFSRPARRRLVEGDRIADVVVAAEPVWNVRARAVASFLLTSAVTLVRAGEAPRPAELADLTPNMAADVVLACLAYGQAAAASQHAPVAFHLPAPLAAVTYSTARYRILQALQRLDPAVRRFIILELEGLPQGIPASRLTELVTMLAPYGRAVLARAPDELADLSSWRRCGLSGISLNASHILASDRGAQARLLRFAAEAAEVARAAAIYGLASRSLLLSAWSAGFSHLAGDEVRRVIARPAATRVLPQQVFCRPAQAA